MADWLPESLLEMHFHSALINYYAQQYGAKFLKLYKPVPQKEVWVGFDQGWTRSNLTEQQLFQALKDAIRTNSSQIDQFFLGEFLQFKVVNRVSRRVKNMPSAYTPPFFRSELSLNPKKTTGISQHETLLRLSAVNNATVLYSCPMIFSHDELWDPPDLKKLRFVNVTGAPSGWATNESHYITFQSANDSNPQWCSEPVEGFAFGIDERAEKQLIPRRLTGEAAEELLRNAAHAISRTLELPGFEFGLTRYLPDCFSLMQFERTGG